jgi:hypothetical protein
MDSHLPDSQQPRLNGPVRRTLHFNDPQTPYDKTKGNLSKTRHWGQRKLLLNEIEFLTNYSFKNATVVYVGSAPGTHIPLLVDLFPALKFHLYDPRPHAPSLVKHERVKVFEERFTDLVAKHYRGQHVLFLSDIRTGTDNDDKPEFEKAVKQDMSDQLRWHQLMQPFRSNLKFRLPWYDDEKTTFVYPDGLVYLPVWGRLTTTEARFVPLTDKLHEWNSVKYNAQMFHFNLQRPRYYDHGMKSCHCYDCAAEIQILRQYLLFKQNPGDVPDDPTGRGAVLYRKWTQSKQQTTIDIHVQLLRARIDRVLT